MISEESNGKELKALNLANTKALMEKKCLNRDLDTWIIRVFSHGDEGIIASDNANEDTLFDIASCGKILHTTPLILQAAGEGRLTLDSTLAEFFPDAPEEKKPVTVRQLLTHTSGIVRIPLPREICAQGLEATAAHILSAPLRFAPGTDYIYSCNGMILLGFILEKLYGKTLETLFQERLFKPLGMTRSCFRISLTEENAAICYTRASHEGSCFDDDNIRALGRVCGSGGSFFTLHDITRYLKAVRSRDEKLYPAAFFTLAEKDYTPSFSEGRGLGYLVVDGRYPQTGNLFPAGSFGHCGHTGQSIFMNREKDLSVVILTNATRFSAMKCGFKSHNYESVMQMRADIHNAILADLGVR